MSVQFHPQHAEFHNATIEEVEQAVARAAYCAFNAPWWIGDGIVYAERRWPSNDIYAQVVPEGPYSMGHLMRLRKTCELYSPDQRHPTLSHKHHQDHQKKPAFMREAILRKAAEDKLRSDEARHLT